MSDLHRRLRAALDASRGPAGAAPPVRPGDRVLVYGAGSTGAQVLPLLRGLGAEVLGFLDANRAGSAGPGGLAVQHPSAGAVAAAERRDLVVVIAVFNRDADVAAIRRLLAAEGYERVVGFPELHRRHAAALGPRYWLDDPCRIVEEADEVLSVLDLWADEASRERYVSLLEYRLLADETRLPPPDEGPQYFPPDLPPVPTPLRIVDAGAYVGDTLQEFVAHGFAIDTACAFEPDPANFRALAEWASGQGRVFLWPCGVWGTTGMLCFAAGNGEASSIDVTGDQLVPCVALDDVLRGFAPQLLKLDVEGAEPEALAGAERTIRAARPRLAVCLYHRPDHLWRLPRRVAALGLDYDLHLRLHRFNGFDTVLHAIPRA